VTVKRVGPKAKERCATGFCPSPNIV